jgi:predicted RecB family nuclease
MMKAFDDVAPGQPMSVSATLYTTYVRCPHQALGRAQGIYGPPSKAAFRGSLAHKLFARHLVDGEIGLEEFEQVCKETVGEQLGEQMASLRMTPSEFRALVAEVQSIYERFKALPTTGFIAAEAPFYFEPGAGVTIRGRIDAVFSEPDGTRIVDWKTGSFLGDADPQLDFYAMAWSSVHGEIPVATEASSIATGENVRRVPTLESIEQTADDVADMVTALRGATDSGSDLERRAGPYCNWCPLLDDCDEGTSAVALLQGV